MGIGGTRHVDGYDAAERKRAHRRFADQQSENHSERRSFQLFARCGFARPVLPRAQTGESARPVHGQRGDPDFIVHTLRRPDRRCRDSAAPVRYGAQERATERSRVIDYDRV